MLSCATGLGLKDLLSIRRTSITVNAAPMASREVVSNPTKKIMVSDIVAVPCGLADVNASPDNRWNPKPNKNAGVFVRGRHPYTKPERDRE